MLTSARFEWSADRSALASGEAGAGERVAGVNEAAAAAAANISSDSLESAPESKLRVSGSLTASLPTPLRPAAPARAAVELRYLSTAAVAVEGSVRRRRGGMR